MPLSSGVVEKQHRRDQYLVDQTARSINFKDYPDQYDLDDNRENPVLPFFELNAIVAATDNFSSSKKLGQGGFGSVYKVISLPSIT